jgi:hypothetical protein
MGLDWQAARRKLDHDAEFRYAFDLGRQYERIRRELLETGVQGEDVIDRAATVRMEGWAIAGARGDVFTIETLTLGADPLIFGSPPDGPEPTSSAGQHRLDCATFSTRGVCDCKLGAGDSRGPNTL